MTTAFRDCAAGVHDLGAAVQTVVDRLGGPLGGVMVQMNGCVVEVEWHDQQPGASAPGASAGSGSAAGEPVPASAELAPDAVVITAGLVGTFYSRPAPDAPPFVEVGDAVAAGQQVAVIETMKLFTPVVSEQAGRVAALHVKDGDVVEFGQRLLEIVVDS